MVYRFLFEKTGVGLVEIKKLWTLDEMLDALIALEDRDEIMAIVHASQQKEAQ